MKKTLYLLLLVSFTGFGQNNSPCETTTPDALGPYFLDGSPYTESIVADDYNGALLFLSGTLLNNCETPISNAILEFWQTDENGDYDYDGYRYRGKIITDAQGNYTIETIIPGKYLAGSQYRPAHIHIMVLVDGTNELASQIYFEGDTDIASDYLASSPAAVNRIIPLYAGVAGDWFGTFNIVLSLENYTINGCTNPNASNYNPEATLDDGSCISIVQQLIESFEAWNFTIDLDSGWNMFGYTCPTPIDLVEGLSNYYTKIIIVKDYLGSTYLPEWNFNGIGDLNPGLGYQIKVTEAIDDFSLCDWYMNDTIENAINALQDYIAQLEDSIEILNQPAYELGDFAEGGIVFYIDATGLHGLTCATEDIGQFDWGCYAENFNGANGLEIGSGFQNTQEIINQNCTSQFLNSTAALSAHQYAGNGFQDWYLPSFDELNEMYNQIGPGSVIGNTGGFSDFPYWSSSKVDNWHSWSILFGSGAEFQSNQNAVYLVRPIRSF